MLYLAIIAEFLLILALAWLISIFVKRINTLVEEYDKLDQGMSEITDAYETDSLQYEETIENLHTELNRYKENNSTLIHNAMIDRTARHEQEKTIHSLREEVAGVKRQLDIAQHIISEHDLNCLPHITLSSMEQDTPLPM
jgi:DNA repair exonuclease SbcCD ATPase subunit